MKKYTIGIIGGSGYVGSALARHLSRKYKVIIVDKSPYIGEDRSDCLEYRSCDILEYEKVRQAMSDIDVVIHTAIIQIPLINEQRKLGYEVNILGTQNICKSVNEVPSVKGMILAGTWHVFGEENLEGTIDEKFGFRPDKVEERAYLYALSKIGQEVIVRFYDQMSNKAYGIIRLGTVLGKGMPEKTAANIFISKGIKGESITPYKHSLYRPMLYVDLEDVCKGFEAYIEKILENKIKKTDNAASGIVNFCWPSPITIIELAQMIRDVTIELTKGNVNPKIEVIDKMLPILHNPEAAAKMRVNVSRIEEFLGLKELKSPRESLKNIIGEALLASSGHT